MCLLDELHEYDQDENSRKAKYVLLSHDVFTFRKVQVAIEQVGDLFQRAMEFCPVLLAGYFAWRQAHQQLCLYPSVNESYYFSSY